MSCRVLADMLAQISEPGGGDLTQVERHVAACPHCAADLAAPDRAPFLGEIRQEHLTAEEFEELIPQPEESISEYRRGLWAHVARCPSCCEELRMIREVEAQPDPPAESPLLSLEEVRKLWGRQRPGTAKLIVKLVDRGLALISPPQVPMLAIERRAGNERDTAMLRGESGQEIVKDERQVGPFVIRVLFSVSIEQRCELQVELDNWRPEEHLRLLLHRVGDPDPLDDLEVRDARVDLGARGPGRYELSVMADNELVGVVPIEIA